MVDVTSIVYITFVGLILFGLGRYFEDYAIGVLGGLLLFLLGLSIWITPISDVSSLLNTIIGSILFGVGAYVWVRGGIEFINTSWTGK